MTTGTTLRDRLAAAGGLPCGWVSLPEPLVGEAVVRAGFEAVLLDMQHGLVDFAPLSASSPASGAAAVTPSRAFRSASTRRLPPARCRRRDDRRAHDRERGGRGGLRVLREIPPARPPLLGADPGRPGGRHRRRDLPHQRQSRHARRRHDRDAQGPRRRRRHPRPRGDRRRLHRPRGSLHRPVGRRGAGRRFGCQPAGLRPGRCGDEGGRQVRGIYAMSGAHARRYHALGFAFTTIQSELGYIAAGAKVALDAAKA